MSDNELKRELTKYLHKALFLNQNESYDLVADIMEIIKRYK